MEIDWKAGLDQSDIALLTQLLTLKSQENEPVAIFCNFVVSSENLRTIFGWNRQQQTIFLVSVINALKKYNWSISPKHQTHDF